MNTTSKIFQIIKSFFFCNAPNRLLAGWLPAYLPAWLPAWLPKLAQTSHGWSKIAQVPKTSRD